MKWAACKKDGKYYFAGFSTPPNDAEETELYDDPQDDIVEVIKANAPKQKSVADLDVEVQEIRQELETKGVIETKG